MRYQEYAVEHTTRRPGRRREKTVTEFGADQAGAVRFRDDLLNRSTPATLVAHTVTIGRWQRVKG